MKWINALCVAGALTLAGCAGPVTPYGPEGITGGYMENKLSDDAYRIYVGGNGFASLSYVEAMAMMRAAELTRRDGFERFVVTNDQIGLGSVDMIAQLQGRRDYHFVTGAGPNMARLYHSAGLPFSEPLPAPQEVWTTIHDKPGGYIEIKMVKNGDPGGAGAVDAAALIERLRPLFVQPPKRDRP